MKAKSAILLSAILYAGVCCTDRNEIEEHPGTAGPETEQLETDLKITNDNTTVAYQKLAEGLIIVGKTEVKAPDGTVTGYFLEFSDGTSYNVRFGDRFMTSAPVIGEDSEGYWAFSFDRGDSWTRIEGNTKVSRRPALLGLDKEYFWTISTGAKYKQLMDGSGRPVKASECTPVKGNSIFSGISCDDRKMTFSLVTGRTLENIVDDSFSLSIDIEDKPSIKLGETRKIPVKKQSVASFEIQCPENWHASLYDDGQGSWLDVTAPQDASEGTYDIVITYMSDKGYVRKSVLRFTLLMISIDFDGCEEWDGFLEEKGKGLLLDYSYAGYNHGETAPADVWSLGYKVYDVTDFGAVPDDGKSDRDAFLKALEKALGTPDRSNSSRIAFPNKPSANAIIYFPEGEFILHTAEDDVTEDGKQVSQGIVIRAGNFIIKGAGRDRTTIVMQDPNQPVNPKVMYSSPDMLLITHWTAFSSQNNWDVTEDAARGSFSVELAGHELKAGDWVCLHILSKDTGFLKEELYPHYTEAMNYSGGSWSILKNGAEVNDFHQVRSVSGNTVTFHEPIMHEIKAQYGWKVYRYPNYSNVGIEDITFRGNAKEHFVHHGSWEDDGAYKPISMTRLTDSWLRRCGFESTSEACSVSSCANVSVYDITFSGRRGHSSIRSAGSSRVFIGATVDRTSGDLIGSRQFCENAGNYHAVGVSKPSMGAVLWRNTWGDDSCFESHATQPRATLIDCCRGGFMRYRMGGDADELPNHLSDLTLWNFEMTSANKGGQSGNDYSNWLWWGQQGSAYWTTLPPIIVGFHGVTPVSFTEEKGDTRHIGSNGTPVQPESLYEAQLQARLGYVPAWLNALK